MRVRIPTAGQFAFLMLVLAVVACAGAPVQEMSNARQAVAAARQMGAAQTATREMAEAERLLQAAQAALDKGDYGTARADANRAREHAVKALRIAQQQGSGGPSPP
ncbi:MAG: DUF4398 domain-containing protein [Gammaproteobacteria bacterium]|nr:DUF4398 domain-containing protein [Gammaproteobacteria bacterium]